MSQPSSLNFSEAEDLQRKIVQAFGYGPEWRQFVQLKQDYFRLREKEIREEDQRASFLDKEMD